MRHLTLLATAAALALATAGAASASQLYGLVVGINAYHSLAPLDAAVDDARDIAGALRQAGAADVTLLLDDQATRENIAAGWRRILDRARPGDTVVFSYAGHGAQEPERVKGSEADGKDEVLVLGGFREQRPGNGQRIIDDELNEWFQEAKDLNVIFVADTCHSGTLTRSIDSRATSLGTRFTSYGPIVDDELTLPPETKSAALAGDNLPNITYLSAVSDNELAPELYIDGHARGALSWSFARALRGAADGNGDGRLSNTELENFVLESVRMVAESRQHPNVRPEASETRDLVVLANVQPTPQPEATPFNPAALDTAPLTLRVVGGAAADVGTRLQRVRVVGADQPAALTWDLAAGEMVGVVGDVVARVAADDLATAQAVVDRWLLLDALRAEAEMNNNGLRLTLRPDDGLHRNGSDIEFVLEGLRHKNALLFSLTPDGKLSLVYPLAQDFKGGTAWPTLPPGLPFTLKARVGAPFGAEHLVAVTSAAPPEALLQRLRSLDGRAVAPELRAALPELLAKAAAERGLQITVAGLFTAE